MTDEIKRNDVAGFTFSDEKGVKSLTNSSIVGENECIDNAVFSPDAAVNFRTNGWFKTSTIFLKS